MQFGVLPRSGTFLDRKLRRQEPVARRPINSVAEKIIQRQRIVAACYRNCRNRMHFLEVKYLLLQSRLNVTTDANRRWRTIEVAEEIAAKHDITVNDLLADGRVKYIVNARHEFWYELAARTRKSLCQIGNESGGRDHTTVRSGIIRHVERTGVAPIRGLKPRQRTASMPKSFDKKWTADKIDGVLHLLDEGLTYSEISEALGESRSAIWSAVYRDNRFYAD